MVICRGVICVVIGSKLFFCYIMLVYGVYRFIFIFYSCYNLKCCVVLLFFIFLEIFIEKVFQVCVVIIVQVDKVGFERVCEVCQKNYFSEGVYKNYFISFKYKVKVVVLVVCLQGKIFDDVSFMIFLFGELVFIDFVVDLDVEEEFNEVVEGIKNIQL